MQKLKNKTAAILIVLILAIPMSAVMIQTTNAHTPPWTEQSYAYVTTAPDPVGVGQSLAVIMWVDAPLPGAALGNNVRRVDYTLTITAPDGTNTTQTWSVVNDPTGIQSYYFTPTQVGNYTFSFTYPGQTFIWNSTNTPGLDFGLFSTRPSSFYGDIFSAASATATTTVQQTPIESPLDSYPLPTQFWTRPIEGQNTYWYTIASNWLGVPYIQGANPAFGLPGAYQPDGSAPNSAHIMWTKPIQYGGVVGGNDTAFPGEMYYAGNSYNPRFNNPIIMQGTLFYQEPYGNAGSGGFGLSGVSPGGDYVAVDLTTGKELWRVNASATGTLLVPSFGYLYSYESPDQHGVVPDGLLIATTNVPGQGTVWRGYDPRTGVLTSMDVTNVPSGVSIPGPSGEILKYVLSNLGTNANPEWYLAQWNSSDVFGAGNVVTNFAATNWYSGTVNASLPSCYDWNISLPSLSGTGWSIGTAALGVIPLVNLGDKMLLIQGTFGGHIFDFAATVSTYPANITAISLNPQTIGQVLWTQSYPQAPGNNTRTIAGWDPSNGVFVFEDKESMTHYGYSLSNGELLWGPATVPRSTSSDWNFLSLDQDIVANGNIYWYGYTGFLYCFNDKTGQLLWTYGNGGEGNSTYSGFTTPWGYYPIFISTVADGKVYLVDDEHSPNSPLYKGEELRAINATDGTEIWTISDYGNAMYGGVSPIADGYLTTLNNYDSQIYCYGRGPSKLTVTAANPVVTMDEPVVIRGTVTDVSAGTQQNEQASNFPNGVPAVSDASQSQWMEYVYMQKPKPSNATGVPVSINVIDSNGNYRQIGTTTSDSSGMFTFAWKPDIPGSFTVIATFAGSNSYWPSSDETSFVAITASPTASPNPAVNSPPTEMYIGLAATAIIIAIAIVGAIIVLMLRKRP